MLLISRRFGIFLAALDPRLGHRHPCPQTSHRTAMGFTPWPVDFNEDGLKRTYAFRAGAIRTSWPITSMAESPW